MKQSIYIDTGFLVLLASVSSEDKKSFVSVLEDNLQKGRVAVTSSLAIGETVSYFQNFHRIGAFDEFYQFLRPVMDTILEFQESDVARALQLSRNHGLNIRMALHCAIALNHAVDYIMTPEDLPVLPGLNSLTLKSPLRR